VVGEKGGVMNPADSNRTVFRPSPLQGAKAAQRVAEPEAPPRDRWAGELATNAAAATGVHNRMLAQARNLLALLMAVRTGRVAVDLPHLHKTALAGITEFREKLRPFYNDDKILRAAYALCSTTDDIAQNLPGNPESAEWARRALTVHFFKEVGGGDRFWDLLEQMIQNPRDYQDILELYHACMAAGFEGRYRVRPNGKTELKEVMQRAFAAQDHPRQLSQIELTPHWRGVQTEVARVGFWTPMSLTLAATAAVLLVIYIGLRLILAEQSGAVVAALTSINPEEPLRLARTAPPPPAPVQSTQLQRIRTFLAPEIERKLVEVFEDASAIRIRTLASDLFASGSAEVSANTIPLYSRIAAALDKERGAITVEGHTDSAQISTLAYPDNMALSRARAAAIATLIRGSLSDGNRITARGFGDAQPIASNRTPEGRARNRRVEITIEREVR
jgi:type VI secretion system protein ImpK